MRKNLGSKPAMYPMPVLIVAAYGEDGTANAMTAAWGGIVDTNLLGICLSAGHKTTQNIFAKGCYTVSMATADYMTQADYLGIVSGNQEKDKLAKAGLHTSRSDFVDAPLIDELPMALECKLVSYDKSTGYLIGEIVNISVEESVLNEAGKVDPARLKPITFDPMNNQYLVLGEKVGNAYQEGKKLK